MNAEEIMNLKGAALKAKASDLQIPGRASMKADTLRTALVDYYENEWAQEGINNSIGTPPVNASLLRQATSNVLGSASPMDLSKRKFVYQAMNNSANITPRQRRRMNKKGHRTLRPGYAVGGE